MGKVVAIHQPNFMPWFPFFYKMASCDVFVLLMHCQFEKNGYQNRFLYKDKWITNPVRSGTGLIFDKAYTNGVSVSSMNCNLIHEFAGLLDINVQIEESHSCIWEEKSMTTSQKLAEEVLAVEGNQYLTNPDALSKYLNKEVFDKRKIELQYLRVPKNLCKSTWEIIEQYGIEGARKLLPKRAK